MIYDWNDVANHWSKVIKNKLKWYLDWQNRIFKKNSDVFIDKMISLENNFFWN